MSNRAVVLISGGIDSAVTLAIARHKKFDCYAISFDYGQRHHVELDAAVKVAKQLKALEHRIFPIDLAMFGGSALTADIEVPKDRDIIKKKESAVLSASEQEALNYDSHTIKRKEEKTMPKNVGSIPKTYVPARNTIFLSIALAYAEVVEARDIFIGATAIDYSGYPDCRPEFLSAFEKTANLATSYAIGGPKISINAPLLYLSKGEIIKKGYGMGVDYAPTISCYDPEPDGTHCGRCDSCQFRKNGFAEADVEDQTRYREQ